MANLKSEERGPRIVHQIRYVNLSAPAACKLFGKDFQAFCQENACFCQVFPNISLAVLSFFNLLGGEKSFFLRKSTLVKFLIPAEPRMPTPFALSLPNNSGAPAFLTRRDASTGSDFPEAILRRSADEPEGRGVGASTKSRTARTQSAPLRSVNLYFVDPRGDLTLALFLSASASVFDVRLSDFYKPMLRSAPLSWLRDDLHSRRPARRPSRSNPTCTRSPH